MFGRLIAISATLALVLPAAAAADPPEWGATQVVPQVDGEDQEVPRVAAFPDGTLVAVWEQDVTAPGDDLTGIFRSTRPRGGEWSEPEAFPVADVWNLQAIAPRPDGSLQIGYGREPRFADLQHQVRIWYADGTVGPVGPGNGSDDYALVGDARGDVVAERFGRRPSDVLTRVLRYHDGNAWHVMPTLRAYPNDVFVAGPGESVWAASYDTERTVLSVRRWAPGRRHWRVQWSRDYPGRARKPLVQQLDLAAGARGRLVLGFAERETALTGPTLRVVRRHGSRWGGVRRLARLPVDQRVTLTGPVVAASGRRAEVAWTSSAPQRRGRREVWVARLGADRDRRLLDTVGSFGGFRDLSLTLDLRAGDVLVTYLERDDDLRRLVGWLGPHDGLLRSALLEDAGVMLDSPALLVPGVAAVVSSVRDGMRSRAAESP